MTRGLGTGVWLLAATLLAGGAAARAQVQSVDTSQPIVIRSTKPRSPKIAKFRCQFLSSTDVAVTVRDRNNSYMVRTFSYGPEARAKMLKVASQGGYRYGDNVEVEYAAGTNVALRIKGKPSSKTN